MRSSRQPSRAQSAEMQACASCPSELPGKQSPGDLKDNQHRKRQVFRIGFHRVAGVLSEASLEQILLRQAGEARAGSVSAARDSVTATGAHRVLRLAAQGHLERGAESLLTTHAGCGLPAPFSWQKRLAARVTQPPVAIPARSGNIAFCDGRARGRNLGRHSAQRVTRRGVGRFFVHHPFAEPKGTAQPGVNRGITLAWRCAVPPGCLTSSP